MTTLFIEKNGSEYSIYNGSVLLTTVTTELTREAVFELLKSKFKHEIEKSNNRAIINAVKRLKKSLQV